MTSYDMMFGWTNGQWKTVSDWWRTLPEWAKQKAGDYGKEKLYGDCLMQRYLWKTLNNFEPPETLVVFPKACQCCGKPT